MDGILPLWKPAGMTSHDCVMKVRRLYQTKKVGHTGTLDPDAEGVLPLCLGRATKLVPYMTNTTKEYEAAVQIGTATETEDASGKVIDQTYVKTMPSREEIEQVLLQFNGDIEQIPPMYSAIKVNGRRLYEYARAQETVERPRRQVTIEKLQFIPPVENVQHTFNIKVICSKGTYIRTLCVDIGKALGYPAHMAKLVRSKSGFLSKHDTYTFSQLEAAVQDERAHDILLPMLAGIGNMDRLTVDKTMKWRVLQGQKFNIPSTKPATDPFAMVSENELIAIYQYHPEKPGEIKPVRVFN